MSHWAENYIGLPYSEYDCAGLCVKVLREQFDRDISLPDERPSGLRSISEKIDNSKDDYAVPTTDPQEGDAVLMVGRGSLNHIGVVCFINNQMWVLHSVKNTGHTVLHPIHGLNNIGLSVEGYYKWL